MDKAHWGNELEAGLSDSIDICLQGHDTPTTAYQAIIYPWLKAVNDSAVVWGIKPFWNSDTKEIIL
jgi:hypothetical protein